MKDVFVVNGCRTAIGDFGGGLKEVAPAELGAQVIKEAIARAGVDAERVSHGVLGNVIHGEARDMYVSRVACVNGGMPHSSQALTVNRLCGSGLQAIISASQLVMLGDAQIAVGAGAESMSRGGYLLPSARWGARMGHATMTDMMVGALTDPFDTMHMGVTAENIAEKWQFSREAQDEFAVQSHNRAAAATAAGHFSEQITAVDIKTRKGVVRFDKDEHIRVGVTIADMNKLKAVFKKDGTVTAGNASGINDGAAAVVLADGDTVSKENLQPMARMVSYGFAGVDPRFMGEGPIPAVQVALNKAGLSMADIDVIESNEAFAAQAMSVIKGLEFDPTKTNPNGGAIALGHPVGATGAILMVKLIHELTRIQGRYGLVTMCIGGGQGIAAIIERA